MRLITDADLPALASIDGVTFDHMRCFGASLDLRLGRNPPSSSSIPSAAGSLLITVSVGRGKARQRPNSGSSDLQHLVPLAQHDHVAVRQLIESLSGTDQV